MLLFMTIVAFSLIAADEDGNSKDAFVRLGVPKIEKLDYRIHVGKEGKWTAQIAQEYNTEGVVSEDLGAFRDSLFEQAEEAGMTTASWSCDVRNLRCQFESKCESGDVLKLASLFVLIFEDDKCNFLHWDRDSFEWSYIRDEKIPLRKEEGSFARSLADESLNFITQSAFVEILRQKGLRVAELESKPMHQPEIQLVLTTDGRIVAGASAEVSEDRKTLKLDLFPFLNAPPEKWSIRIEGL